MELKLNIYKNQREIEKTYVANTYDIMFGTVEDLVNLLDMEALRGKNGNESLVNALANLVTGSKELLRPLLKDIFPGLTDDELRRVKAKEVLAVAAGLAGFSLDEIKGLYVAGKKAMEGQRMS